MNGVKVRYATAGTSGKYSALCCCTYEGLEPAYVGGLLSGRGSGSVLGFAIDGFCVAQKFLTIACHNTVRRSETRSSITSMRVISLGRAFCCDEFSVFCCVAQPGPSTADLYMFSLACRPA